MDTNVKKSQKSQNHIHEFISRILHHPSSAPSQLQQLFVMCPLQAPRPPSSSRYTRPSQPESLRPCSSTNGTFLPSSS
jgi:hypothetical protein